MQDYGVCVYEKVCEYFQCLVLWVKCVGCVLRCASVTIPVGTCAHVCVWVSVFISSRSLKVQMDHAAVWIHPQAWKSANNGKNKSLPSESVVKRLYLQPTFYQLAQVFPVEHFWKWYCFIITLTFRVRLTFCFVALQWSNTKWEGFMFPVNEAGSNVSPASWYSHISHSHEYSHNDRSKQFACVKQLFT